VNTTSISAQHKSTAALRNAFSSICGVIFVTCVHVRFRKQIGTLWTHCVMILKTLPVRILVHYFNYDCPKVSISAHIDIGCKEVKLLTTKGLISGTNPLRERN
jgi:hypothetical protein